MPITSLHHMPRIVQFDSLPHRMQHDARRSGTGEYSQAAGPNADHKRAAISHQFITEIQQAIDSGNVWDITPLLARLTREEIKRQDKEESFVYRAVLRDNPSALRLLLNEGLNVMGECAASSGESALHLAARKGNPDILELLLNHKDVAINKMDSKDFTPLHRAAEVGCVTSIEMLLTCNAAPNVQTRYARRTPLHLAAANGHHLAVRALMSCKDVDFKCFDQNFQSPVTLAANNGHHQVVNEFLNSSRPVLSWWVGRRIARCFGFNHRWL